MNTQQTRRKLLMATGLTYRQWALAHHYQPRTVTQVVSRYAGSSVLPRGRLSFAILRKLSRDIGHEVVPGVLKAAA